MPHPSYGLVHTNFLPPAARSFLLFLCIPLLYSYFSTSFPFLRPFRTASVAFFHSLTILFTFGRWGFPAARLFDVFFHVFSMGFLCFRMIFLDSRAPGNLMARPYDKIRTVWSALMVCFFLFSHSPLLPLHPSLSAPSHRLQKKRPMKADRSRLTL